MGIATVLIGLLAFLDYGWRIPFLISIVLVAADLYVRLTIEETPVFRQTQRQQPMTHTPLHAAFTQAPREILLAAGSVTIMFALGYTGTTFLISYGTSPTGVGLSRTVVLSLGIAGGAATALGMILSAIYSERLGRRNLIMASCAAAAVWSLLLFPLLDTRSPVAFAVGAIPPLVSAPLAAAFGSFAIGILLCGLALLSLFCTAALAETKDRDLPQAR